MIHQLENGNLLIPRRAEGQNGEVGDAVEEIDATHPRFFVWLEAFERERARPSSISK